MKRISIIRVLLLLSLFTVGLLSLFAIPMDDSPTWTSDLIISKAFAFISLWLFNRLYERWKVADQIIRAFDKWNSNEIEHTTEKTIGPIEKNRA